MIKEAKLFLVSPDGQNMLSECYSWQKREDGLLSERYSSEVNVRSDVPYLIRLVLEKRLPQNIFTGFGPVGVSEYIKLKINDERCEFTAECLQSKPDIIDIRFSSGVFSSCLAVVEFSLELNISDSSSFFTFGFAIEGMGDRLKRLVSYVKKICIRFYHQSKDSGQR